jgi:aspartate/methionine/tyrosine aminotransferase
MNPSALNELLARHHPAASRMLSRTGQRAALPFGIPQQTMQARSAELRATIGEITHGNGVPIALPAMTRFLHELNLVQSLRYAPAAGLPGLRARWRELLIERAQKQGIKNFACSLPVVTSGITHALSICAELFVDSERPLVLGAPWWDNYDALFSLRSGASLIPFATHTHPGQGFNLEGLKNALSSLKGPASVLLNFPNNPTGYSPDRTEAADLIELLLKHPHPLCILLDDAYAGLYYEPTTYPNSLFAELSFRADPEKTLICKADGATKELVFFGGRVGFVTFSASGEAGAVLEEKAAALVRATISSASALSESLVLETLQSPELESQILHVRALLNDRYQALHAALAEADLSHFAFNSGCFALLPVRHDLPGDPALFPSERARLRLLQEQSVGVISVPPAGIRVAFCSMEPPEIREAILRIARVLKKGTSG